MDFKLLMLVGFLAVFAGMLIAFSKHQEEKVKILFVGILITILGFIIVSIAFTQTYVDYKINETKEEILQIVYEQKYVDEIEYSAVEYDSITDNIIYRQCSIDTTCLR